MVGKLEPHGHGLVCRGLHLVMASSQEQNRCTDNRDSPLNVRGHGLTRATEDIHLSTFHKLGLVDLGQAADAKHPDLTRVFETFAIRIGALFLSGSLRKRLQQTAAYTQAFACEMPNRKRTLIAVE
jgi:hypothetical protein